MKKYHKSTNNATTFPENLAQSLTSLLQNPTIHATRLLAAALAEALLQAEADAICGPRYKNNPHRQLYRWGSQPCYVCVAAVKTPITRPRVRTKNDGGCVRQGCVSLKRKQMTETGGRRDDVYHLFL